MAQSAGWENPGHLRGERGVGCALCHETVRLGQLAYENKVFKCGELQYIEIAHADCVFKERN